MDKRILVVFDFDGFLVNSYEMIRSTFERLGLDIGDQERFTNRRKFLKYLGGGKELVRNFVTSSLPRKRYLRQMLTEEFLGNGRVYPPFVPFLNRLVEDGDVHVGVVSRNFTLQPGPTIRSVLRASGVKEAGLDFVIPLPIGGAKKDILHAMRSDRFRTCVLGGDEISDWEAARLASYEPVIATYGFDKRERLLTKGLVPEEVLVDTPEQAIAAIGARIG